MTPPRPSVGSEGGTSPSTPLCATGAFRWRLRGQADFSHRVAIVGSSGSGKSTLARRLGESIGAPVIELDALNWGPDWYDHSKRDPEELVRRVDAVIAGEAWVTDGNYSVVRARILRRATDVVWLDYDRSVIMSRVLKRSFGRALRKEELWPGTGNREEFRAWLSKDHPIRWAWDTYDRRRAAYAEMFADSSLAGRALHRLRHPREAEALIASFPASPPAVMARASGEPKTPEGEDQ